MAVKITRFRDIPPFVRDGSYEIDCALVGTTSVSEWVQKQIEDSNLNIDPDFQRPHVWTKVQQARWIEHMLRGGRSGRVLYFNHPGWQRDYEGEMVLVDGKQRLKAIMDFETNKFKVFGSYYSEFTDRCGYGCTVRINVNSLRTKEMVLAWYLQMNSGGTPHTRAQLQKVVDMLAEGRK